MGKIRVEIDLEHGGEDTGWKEGLREMSESEVHIYLDRSFGDTTVSYVRKLMNGHLKFALFVCRFYLKQKTISKYGILIMLHVLKYLEENSLMSAVNLLEMCPK